MIAMKRLKFHHTQNIIEENKTEKYLIIGIELRLKHEKFIGEDILSRNQALSFLLGRFGNYATVINYKEI